MIRHRSSLHTHRPWTHLPHDVRSIGLAGIAASVLGLAAAPAAAFCGFYVAKVDTKLYNRASQVVLVRDGDRTVITMSNDFRGDPKEFAVVVPVPTFLQREQIHIGDKAIVEHLDAYSAPRLVEYFDPDPCQVMTMKDGAMSRMPQAATPAAVREEKSHGVTVEAQYTVGEYDIVILSAEQSNGLEIWLRENGYRVPRNASRVLGSYIKQGMRFFVAKVNLEKQSALGFSYLRPLQMAYESPKFMLPLRLGMVNANGPQELFVYALTRRGRVETTNYRSVKLPTGMDIPLYVKDRFSDFYKALFDAQVTKEDMRAVFLEYAWDMTWCDPCAADPLSRDELRQLGAFWLEPSPGVGQWNPGGGGPQEAFLTRLHVRYDAAHFPEDLVFQETSDRENFQGRYVLRHPWTGKGDCAQTPEYRQELRRRQDATARNLATLTGWDLAEIRRQMRRSGETADAANVQWWQNIWRN